MSPIPHRIVSFVTGSRSTRTVALVEVISLRAELIFSTSACVLGTMARGKTGFGNSGIGKGVAPASLARVVRRAIPSSLPMATTSPVSAWGTFFCFVPSKTNRSRISTFVPVPVSKQVIPSFIVPWMTRA